MFSATFEHKKNIYKICDALNSKNRDTMCLEEYGQRHGNNDGNMTFMLILSSCLFFFSFIQMNGNDYNGYAKSNGD